MWYQLRSDRTGRIVEIDDNAINAHQRLVETYEQNTKPFPNRVGDNIVLTQETCTGCLIWEVGLI